ncbi:MAG: signal peptide peptidase SppA [Spirochaetaceae bacterium]|nr:MAG: signal peptide peptidase SppA [Spirochaetaceae bacterium]
MHRGTRVVTVFCRALVLGAALTLSAASARAERLAWTGIAIHDGPFSAVVNPAALAIGNASGVAVDVGVAYPVEDASFYLNAPGFAYVARVSTGSVAHRLASASGFGPALSIGSAWSWNGAALRAGTLDLSVLSRLSRSIAVGTVARDAFGDEGELAFGLGVRPFGGSPVLGSRLTIAADASWNYSDEFAVTGISAEIEPVDGVRLSAGYSPVDGRVAIRLGLNTRQTEVGTAYVSGGTTPLRSSVFLALRPRRSIFAVAMPVVVDYDRISRLASVPAVVPFAQSMPLVHVLDDLARLQGDPAVEAIVLVNRAAPVGFAELLELRSALDAFRAAGKRVYYYYDSISRLDYALAAATGDAILLHPLGSVDVRGYAYQGLYFGGLLERYGLRFYSYPSHEFKTANAPLSDREMPDAEREMLTAVGESLYGTYLGLVDRRSDRLADESSRIAADGPYLVASDALAAGVVDALAYPDEIWEVVADAHPGTRRVAPPSVVDMVYDWTPPQRSRVVLIYATGMIVTGDGVRGRMIGSDTMARAIRDAREDPFVRGIVLRIDSGGGSGIASDTIAREVARTVESGKPVVVSMGSTAASGGYYIAAPATHIVASPATITGSIGVVGGFLTVDGLIDRLEIGSATIRTTPRADFPSAFRPPTPAEEAALNATIAATYDRFVAVVASSRGMSTEDVHAVARGRVWTGAQALEHGLVDSLGGFAESFAVMRELLSTPSLEIVEVLPGPSPVSIVSELAALVFPELSLVDALIGNELADAHAMLTLFTRHRGEPLYLLPYRGW